VRRARLVFFSKVRRHSDEISPLRGIVLETGHFALETDGGKVVDENQKLLPN
jgi:hypothetical protein